MVEEEGVEEGEVPLDVPIQVLLSGPKAHLLTRGGRCAWM